jgi:hypothetical protein
MLSFLKKIFGPKTTDVSSAPYKVETPAPVAEATPTVKKVAKTPAVKKATARKPRTPKV